MSWPPDSSTTFAWLYTRGAASVRIEVRASGARTGLLVSGPGPNRQFFACGDSWELIECQIAQEAQLLAQGYALEGCTADRRRRRGNEAELAPAEILRHRGRSRS